MESRRSDDLLTLLIYHDKRPTRFQGFFEEDSEHVFFIAVALGMLFPDERVRRDGKKIVPIFRPERAKLDEFAF